MKTQKLASYISQIFSAIFLVPFFLVISNCFFIQNVLWTKNLLFSLLFFYLLPLLYYFLAFKQKMISDWDIFKRGERKQFNLKMLFFMMLGLLFFYFTGEKELIYFYFKTMIPFLVYFVLTLFWQVSGHTLMSSFTILLLYLYIDKSIILYLGLLWISLIAWARIELKRHTWLQVVVGAIIPLCYLLLR